MPRQKETGHGIHQVATEKQLNKTLKQDGKKGCKEREKPEYGPVEDEAQRKGGVS